MRVYHVLCSGYEKMTSLAGAQVIRCPSYRELAIFQYFLYIFIIHNISNKTIERTFVLCTTHAGSQMY